MIDKVSVTVKNQLVMGMRYLNVCLSKKSAHIISYNSSKTFLLGMVGSENNYIHISAHIESRNSDWTDFFIDLPSWADFDFSSEGNILLSHKGGRIILRLCGIPPDWQLKIARPELNGIHRKEDYIIVGDESPVGR